MMRPDAIDLISMSCVAWISPAALIGTRMSPRDTFPIFGCSQIGIIVRERAT